MSNPIYHEQIIELRSYALKLNWFQKLFFPTKVMDDLHRYTTDTPDPSKAFQIYAKLSQNSGFFNWVRMKILSGLRRFAQDLLTQNVNNLQPLTEENFIRLASPESLTKSPQEQLPPLQQKPVTPLDLASLRRPITPPNTPNNQLLQEPSERSRYTNVATPTSPVHSIYKSEAPAPSGVGVALPEMRGFMRPAAVMAEPINHNPPCATLSAKSNIPSQEKVPAKRFCC